MSRGLSIYNQTVQGDDEFVLNFVARHNVLDALVRRLRAFGAGDGQHHLLIGPRGMGKTSMLRRLAIAINRMPELATHFVPLKFREEQYNVLTLGDFWRNCAEALAEWAEDNDHGELAVAIDEALAGSSWNSDEKAGSEFEAVMTGLKRRAVLLVDNLDLILNTLSSEDNWRLRKALQAFGGPVVIGAATQPLRQSGDRDAAFYEFFQPHYLEPLDAAETESCMRALAQGRGVEGARVVRVLNSQPERLRTLHTLTGGNPRVLALIYRLLESAESDAAMADLEILLDQVTPYYKARVEEYQGAQQRAVLDAIALHWNPITTGDLSTLTNIVVTSLTSHLNRLRKDGLVETVETSGSYSGHQLVERFFNIWYLMRHGTRRAKQKMRWLVAFLTSFYSKQELTEIVNRARSCGAVKNWHIDYALAFEEALSRGSKDQPEIVVPVPSTPATLAAREAEAVELAEAASTAWQAGDAQSSEEGLIQLITKFDAAETPILAEQVAQAMYNQAIIVSYRDEYDAELRWYDTLITRFGDSERPEIEALVSAALLGTGNRLVSLGRDPEAMSAFDELIRRYGRNDSRNHRQHVGTALLEKAEMLLRNQDVAATNEILDDILHRYEADQDDDFGYFAARALVLRALQRETEGNLHGAISCFDVVIERYRDTKSARTIGVVIRSMIGKAVWLSELGDVSAAVQIYDDLLARRAEAEQAGFSIYIDRTRFFRAAAFAQTGKHVEAVAAYDALARDLENAEDDDRIELAGLVLINKARAFDALGDPQAEIAAYDAAIARVAGRDYVSCREITARALLNKAITLGDLNQDGWQEELAVYGQLIDRFAGDEEPEIVESVAKARLYRAVTWGNAGDVEREIEALDQLIADYAKDDNATVRGVGMMAFLARARALIQSGETDLALAEIERFIESASALPDLDGRVSGLIAAAMLERALAFQKLGDTEGEYRTYSELIEIFGALTHPDVVEELVRAYALRGIMRTERGQFGDAIEDLEQAAALAHNGIEDADLQRLLTHTRVRYGNYLFDELGDTGRAEALYDKARETQPVWANANLAWVYLLTGRVEAALLARAAVEDLPEAGRALLDAGIELVRNNFGLMTTHLSKALETGLNLGSHQFDDDVERLLRLAAHHGFGSALIDWFSTSGFADRYAPLVAAFVAHVRGEKTLLDINPEIRGPAKAILVRLAGSGRLIDPGSDKPRRGRPRKG